MASFPDKGKRQKANGQKRLVAFFIFFTFLPFLLSSSAWRCSRCRA